MLWTIAEVTTGIICICLPSATLIFRKSEPRGPSAAILNGTPDTMASRRFPKQRSIYGILDDEEGEYFELRDMDTELVERPEKAYHSKILERVRSHRTRSHRRAGCVVVWCCESEQSYQDVNNAPHEAKFSHEALAGAASFGAFKIFEDRQRAEGKPVSHQFAKELLVGLVGGEVDKLAETKGEDFIDRERAKHHARENVEQMYDEHYGGQDQYDPWYPKTMEHGTLEDGDRLIAKINVNINIGISISIGINTGISNIKYRSPTLRIIEPRSRIIIISQTTMTKNRMPLRGSKSTMSLRRSGNNNSAMQPGVDSLQHLEQVMNSGAIQTNVDSVLPLEQARAALGRASPNPPQSQSCSKPQADASYKQTARHDTFEDSEFPLIGALQPSSVTSTLSGEAPRSLFEGFSQIHARPSERDGGRMHAPNTEKLYIQLMEEEAQKHHQKQDFALKEPKVYTEPFCNFLTENPTVWHAVGYFEQRLEKGGYKKLSESSTWNASLELGGKYYVSRNGSSLIAFEVGDKYESGNGVAMIAGHIDAITARLKPVSTKPNKAGYVQLGVAPYAGGLNATWWDRDLGIGGRVIVKDEETGKVSVKLVKLGWPIAKVPTLAPHFGQGIMGTNNPETQAVPIIGLDSSPSTSDPSFKPQTLGSFASTQPPKLLHLIAKELQIDPSSILNWDLELFDTQPAQVGGLDKEFIFGGRIDDKICSWSAVEGLLSSTSSTSSSSSIIKLVSLFDNEEIGSLTRQGAHGDFLSRTIERINEVFSSPSSTANSLAQVYANSFLISADVTHATHPNFLSLYLENHAPSLNTGLVICTDVNGRMTTDSISAAIMSRIAENYDCTLQKFMIRNDSRSGGTVGPMLSSKMGVRSVDAGLPQLSMHSVRATTGSLDPGLGVKIFAAFYNAWGVVGREFAN
ncbi:hypothetical protein B7494_g428 [Chlorociboria aeruginascens]|nr:hypothetical protein B7494_g428 [Chlorociboria aeruginascens]